MKEDIKLEYAIHILTISLWEWEGENIPELKKAIKLLKNKV